jgi:tetratricopeptide (TPR) repeat protein
MRLEQERIGSAMNELARNVQVVLDEFRRTGDINPLVHASHSLECMEPEESEEREVLSFRALIDFELKRWARVRDHLTKLIAMEPDNIALVRSLSTVNFELRDYDAVVKNLSDVLIHRQDDLEAADYRRIASALHALGRAKEANDILDAAVRRNPALPIYRDPDFLTKQQAARDRDMPAMLINTQFKSASAFIVTRLADGLHLPRCYVTQVGLSRKDIIPSWLDLLAKGGAICQQHLPADPDVLRALDGVGIDRIVVHTRDPRQSMISAIHHFCKLFSNNTYETTVFTSRLPTDFRQWSFNSQVDYYLDEFFTNDAYWISDWRRVVAERTFSGRILLTSYEKFHRDNRTYFEDVLNFYGVPLDRFDWSGFDIKPEIGALHFRSGKTNEWKDVMSTAQIERANAIMTEAGLDPDGFES